MAMKRLACCVGTFVVGVPIAAAFTDHVVDVSRGHGRSMQPLLNPEENDRDVVLVNRWSVRNYPVRRGDIVAITCPIEPRKVIGKRVIALEGDIVRTLGYKEPFVTVPPGHCWVEGDNQKFSTDSNDFGPVSLGLIESKVTHVVWPPRRWQRLSTAVPSDRAPITEQDLLELEEEGTPKLST